MEPCLRWVVWQPPSGSVRMATSDLPSDATTAALALTTSTVVGTLGPVAPVAAGVVASLAPAAQPPPTSGGGAALPAPAANPATAPATAAPQRIRASIGGATTQFSTATVDGVLRPRARQGQPLGGEAVRGGCWVVRAGVWRS
eukprot:COSAG01_NODE_600_length_14996_cov_385.219434_5_plen_143_part_00